MTAISLNLTRSDGELQEFHLDSDDAEVVLEALKQHHDGKGKKKKPPMAEEEMPDEDMEMMDSDDEDGDEWTTEDRDDSDDDSEDEYDESEDDSEAYYEDSEDEDYDEDHTDSDLADLQERIDYLGSMMMGGEMEPDGDEVDYDEIAEDAVDSYKSMMSSAYKATMDYLPADMNPFEVDDPIELYVSAIEELNPDADLEGKSYERIMGIFEALAMGKTDSDDTDSTALQDAAITALTGGLDKQRQDGMMTAMKPLTYSKKSK